MKSRASSHLVVYSFLILLSINVAFSGDITPNAFGSITDAVVSAFGDFNSDELTDVFATSDDGRTLKILLASDTEPLLQSNPKSNCVFSKLQITSIVPGDFDGDAYMDLLITTRTEHPDVLGVYINWGGSDYINCTDESSAPLLRMRGEPVALDYNQDMIIDLFGYSEQKERTFWIFNKGRVAPSRIKMDPPHEHAGELSIPHSHAYLDLNGDFNADLFVSTRNGFEIWHGLERHGFNYSRTVKLPLADDRGVIGQSIFLDIELNGAITQVVPVCYDNDCRNSSILANVNGEFHDLQINFKDETNTAWAFIKPSSRPNQMYQNTITLRGGDFNLDGYTDLLATLQPSTGDCAQTFLLENVPCSYCKHTTRSFAVRWNAFGTTADCTAAGAYYDFYQDGILDVMFVKQRQRQSESSVPLAFRNTLDYDANFVKVMVLTGLTNKHAPTKLTPFGRKKRTYGTNLPGPRIAYYTTKTNGEFQESSSVQIPQSAYFSLHLPYTIFGLGRTPNFVDKLIVGLSHQNRSWSQLIPNSQMVVVPWPPTQPSRWKAQLFVTPSKLIWMSVLSLSATCAVITLIILVLHLKEKREDRLERLNDTERLHFDAI